MIMYYISHDLYLIEYLTGAAVYCHLLSVFKKKKKLFSNIIKNTINQKNRVESERVRLPRVLSREKTHDLTIHPSITRNLIKLGSSKNYLFFSNE